MNCPYAEVIGDPISHSKSPLIHNFWLQKLGIDGEYRACHVSRENLADYFANRRKDPDWCGCNVTIPHKEAVSKYIDHFWPGTLEIGAINTIIKRDGELFGANTDISGIIGPLNASLRYSPPPSQTAAIIGAGGAARAAAAALTAHFPEWPIRFLVRRRDQAQGIVDLLGIAPDIRPIEDSGLIGATLLINASPLGMAGQAPLSLSLTSMHANGTPIVIFDMVYVPLETPLLAAAQRKGFATINGLQMLVAQAAEAFQLLFGLPAPRHHDNELRALLVK
jgi:shikimate dehydrogenase